jgi:hypothetical protein
VWAKPSEDEWRANQRGLLTSDEWILDGDNHTTLDLQVQRADTVVFLDPPWWVSARRAFVRGIRKRLVGFQLPNGCDEPATPTVARRMVAGLAYLARPQI